MRYAKWIAVPVVAGMFVSGGARAADQKQKQPQAQQSAAVKPIGRVTATFGDGKIESAGKTRAANLHEFFTSDDRIVTDGGGLSVLLSTRVVLKIDAETAVRISEGVGQTNVVLEHGTVHIFVGKRSADMGLVALQDNNARVEGLNAVYLASYNPATKESYYACEHDSVRLENKTDGEVMTLGDEKQIVIRDGKVVTNGELDRVAFNSHKQSLDRLGQTTVEQGTETFRLRSRTTDTEVAISQLAAAGWIDRQALTSGVSPSNGSGSGNGKDKSKSSTSSGISSSGSSASSGGSNNTGTATIKSRAQSSAEIAAAEKTAAANNAQLAASSNAAAPAVSKPVVANTNTQSTPPVVPVASDVVDKPADPVADIGNSGKGSKTDKVEKAADPAVTPPVAAPAPIAALPTPTDIGITPPSDAGSLPTLDVDNDSSGKGKGHKNKGRDAVVTVPVPTEVKVPIAADIGITPPAAVVVPPAPTTIVPPVAEVVAPPTTVVPPTTITPPTTLTPPVAIETPTIVAPPTTVTPPIEIAPPVTVSVPAIDLPIASTPTVTPPAETVAPPTTVVPAPIETIVPAPVTVTIPTVLPTPTDVSNSGPGSGATPAAVPNVETRTSKKHRKGS